MIQNFILTNAKSKHPWRYICVVALFLGYSLVQSSLLPLNCSVYELVVSQTEQELLIYFVYSIALLLLVSDAFSNTNRWYDYMAFRCKTRWIWIKCILSYSAIISLLAIIMLFLVNMIVCIFRFGFISCFSNQWSTDEYTEIIARGWNPAFSSMVSLFFLYCRFLFLSLVCLFLNLKFRSGYLGIIGVFCINIIDWQFYGTLNLPYPLGVLPIEHTKIMYTPAMVPQFDEVRIGFLNSIVYWFILITILMVLCFFYWE